MVLFINTPTDTRRFSPIYDTITVWGGHLGLGFKPTNELELTLGGDYRSFNTLRQVQAWHLPPFEANIGAKYHFSKDFEAHLLGFVATGAKVLDMGAKVIAETPKVATLPAMFDINVGASYHISDNFGVFLDLNNVLNQKYQRWSNYQSYGFNLVGGVTLKFK
jgi:outer membrane receptor protein involved in Fe transport